MNCSLQQALQDQIKYVDFYEAFHTTCLKEILEARSQSVDCEYIERFMETQHLSRYKNIQKYEQIMFLLSKTIFENKTYKDDSEKNKHATNYLVYFMHGMSKEYYGYNLAEVYNVLFTHVSFDLKYPFDVAKEAKETVYPMKINRTAYEFNRGNLLRTPNLESDFHENLHL
jgi:hypothetical protein